VTADQFSFFDSSVALSSLVECITLRLRQSPQIAAMPAVTYKNFF
jgi:hypothetical protein